MATASRHYRAVLLALGLAGIFAGGGCVSLPQGLPASYFSVRHDLQVMVTQCSTAPTLVSGAPQGPSLAGAAFLVRETAMKNRLKQLSAGTIKEAVAKAVAAELGGVFQVTGVSSQLVLEVEITSWGWVVPVDARGVATEAYKLQLMGKVRIRDLQSGGQTVYVGYDSAEVPIEMPVTEETCMLAFPAAVDAFAKETARFILRTRPGAAPAAPAVGGGS
jgi:hypothetical protein